MPTETVYGLAGDARNPAAVQRIFELKERPADHPLIVHFLEIGQARSWTTGFGPMGEQLAEVFWPGPLTLVVPAADHVPRQVTGGQTTVGLRVPSHPVAREILRRFGGPLAAPSANRFGRVSPTTAEHVLEGFPGTDLPVVDGGPSEVGIESTIVDCSRPDSITILRPGWITAERVFETVGHWPHSGRDGSPRTAGTHAAHYAPAAQVVVLPDSDWTGFLANDGGSFPKTQLCLHEQPGVPLPDHVSYFLLPSDAGDFAAILYSIFREADRAGIERLVFAPPAERGLGVAIADRLRRAAQGSQRPSGHAPG